MRHFAILIFLVSSFHAFGQTYVYDARDQAEFATVQFSTGEVATVMAAGQQFLDGKKLVFSGGIRGLKNEVVLEHDLISVRAAYPDVKAATVAIVETACMGNGPT